MDLRKELERIYEEAALPPPDPEFTLPEIAVAHGDVVIIGHGSPAENLWDDDHDDEDDDDDLDDDLDDDDDWDDDEDDLDDDFIDADDDEELPF